MTSRFSCVTRSPCSRTCTGRGPRAVIRRCSPSRLSPADPEPPLAAGDGGGRGERLLRAARLRSRDRVDRRTALVRRHGGDARHQLLRDGADGRSRRQAAQSQGDLRAVHQRERVRRGVPSRLGVIVVPVGLVWRGWAPVLDCSEAELVPAGDVVRYRVPLVPAARHLPSGHRLRLVVTSSDKRKGGPTILGFTHTAAGDASINTVHSSSRLLLPLLD